MREAEVSRYEQHALRSGTHDDVIRTKRSLGQIP